MTRIFAAAMLLSVVALPALACEYNKSADTGGKQRTVASQPSDGQSGQQKTDKPS